jgi:hypothetical protein
MFMKLNLYTKYVKAMNMGSCFGLLPKRYIKDSPSRKKKKEKS